MTDLSGYILRFDGGFFSYTSPDGHKSPMFAESWVASRIEEGNDRGEKILFTLIRRDMPELYL